MIEDFMQKPKEEEFKKYFEGGSTLIYHYTTLNTLQKILKRKRWKFNKYNHMRNDSEEGDIIFKAYDAACLKLYSEKKITTKQFEEIHNIEKKMLNMTINYIKTNHSQAHYTHYTPYIACFSSHCDSIRLWDEYCRGSGTGCMIHIYKNDGSFGGKDLWFDDVTKDNIIKISRVRYNFDEIVAKIMNVICEKLSQNGDDYEMIRTRLSLLLYEYRFFIKNEKFSFEGEIRALICLPDLYHSNSDFKEKLDERYGFEIEPESLFINALVDRENVSVTLHSNCFYYQQ